MPDGRGPEGEPFEAEIIGEESEITKEKGDTERFSTEIIQALSDDLKEHGVTEQISNIPILYQEYATDCEIACARMAMAHYGLPVPGTDGFVAQAEQIGLGVTKTTGADGKEGPRGDPALIQNFFIRKQRENGMTAKLSYFIPASNRAAELISAIRKGEPVELSINYHTLYPEDESVLRRNHAVLVKGYKLKENGELVIVANDPKPKVGGEREISQPILAEALQTGFIIYQRTSAEKF
jgi:hypothetical protein